MIGDTKHVRTTIWGKHKALSFSTSTKTIKEKIVKEAEKQGLTTAKWLRDYIEQKMKEDGLI